MTQPDDRLRKAVGDTEAALAGFASAFADGSLGELGVGDAIDLASRASASVNVAANAFGETPLEGDTPDALMGRMLDIYVQQAVESAFVRAHAASQQESMKVYDERRAAMAATLGLSDDDLATLDFDEDNGDPSPWLRMKEEFAFG